MHLSFTNADDWTVCFVDKFPCNSHLLGRLMSGVIMHPNFPFDFVKDRRCFHHIHIPSLPSSSNWKICFTFHRFNMSESCFDDVLEFPDFSQYCGNGSSLRQNASDPMSNIFYSRLCCKYWFWLCCRQVECETHSPDGAVFCYYFSTDISQNSDFRICSDIV